jgi:hypothetical protein
MSLEVVVLLQSTKPEPKSEEAELYPAISRLLETEAVPVMKVRAPVGESGFGR